MKITKIGHCCLLIEEKGIRILTDPGSYTVEAHSRLKDIDFILFTHEHQDHFHIESLKTVLANNQKALVYANSSVSMLLESAGIHHIKMSHLQEASLKGIRLAAFGEKHAQMHSSIPVSENMGFFIDERMWYPGDSFTDPKKTGGDTRPPRIRALDEDK